jgi:hypothetical protein
VPIDNGVCRLARCVPLLFISWTRPRSARKGKAQNVPAAIRDVVAEQGNPMGVSDSLDA